MSIGKRILALRKELNLSQKDFAKPLGLTYAAVGAYENELRNVSEPSIIAICRTYNVNEEWLRTGKGTWHNPLSQNQKIAEFLNDVMEEDNKCFKSRFINALSTLDDKEWEAISNFVDVLNQKE